jgi:hypothetical protein
MNQAILFENCHSSTRYATCPLHSVEWWAHFEFTRINIEPIILGKKIEEPRIVGAFCRSRRRVGLIAS